MKAAVLAGAILLSAGAAHAGGADRWSYVDHGDHVEVIARGVTAASAIATPVRERLEIPLAGDPTPLDQSVSETTLRDVDIRDHAPRVLSVKLRLEHADVVKIAPHTIVTQVGDDLHVLIPRTVAAAETTPAIAPAPVTAAAAPAIAPAIEPKAPAPAPAAKPATPVPAARPDAAPAARPATATSAPLPAGDSPTVPTGTILIGLAAALIGVVAIARKRKKPAPGTALDVVAQRALGGKARIVWLTAGDREIIVSVTPQQVRLLSQWRKPAGARPVVADEPAFTSIIAAATAAAEQDDEPAQPLPRAITHAQHPAPRTSSPNLSPAVSGILRLRERGATLDEDIATGDADADAQWARDVLGAIGGRR